MVVEDAEYGLLRQQLITELHDLEVQKAAVITGIIISPAAAFFGAYSTRYFDGRKNRDIGKNVIRLIRDDLSRYKKLLQAVKGGELVDSGKTYLIDVKSPTFQLAEETLPLSDKHYSAIPVEVRVQVFKFELLDKLVGMYDEIARFNKTAITPIDANGIKEYRFAKDETDKLTEQLSKTLKHLGVKS
jgi:hypothetical protein